jgi:hypothetical protein
MAAWKGWHGGAALALGLCLAGATQAGELRVNSAGWDLALDDNLSLREALLLAQWPLNEFEKRCWRAGEKNRSSGGNWQLANPANSEHCVQPPSCVTSSATCLWVLASLPSYGLGLDHADTLRIDANIGPAQPTAPIFLRSDDRLLGQRPDGQRLQIDGSQLPGSFQALLQIAGTNALIEQVEVYASPTAGIAVTGNGSRIEASFVRNNAGAGIRLLPKQGGPAPFSPRDVTVGSADPGRGNFIVGNGGDGVLLEAVATESGFSHNNKFFANFISGSGSSGIAVFHSRGNLIGDAGLGNEIQSSAGLAGVFIEGENADDNRIAGNLIGVTSGANGNGHGVLILGGADAALIGGSGALANRILGNRGHGIQLIGPDSFDHQILDNAIGASGSTTLGNGGDGIRLQNGVGNVLIRGNTLVRSGYPTALAADAGWGVRIEGPISRFNRVQQNSIGLLGTTAAGNRRGGLAVLDGSESTSVGGAVLGNTIGSNEGPGVLIEGALTAATQLEHNRIGFAVDGGSLSRPNAGSGVLIRGGARDSVIGEGDGSPADSTRRNWISGNARDGIEVLGEASDGVRIRNNYLGTEIVGLGALGNSRNGLYVQDADGIVIERNLISANGNDGIKLEGAVAGAQIQGNGIGLNADRDGVLGNAASGIALLSGPTDTVIGATAANWIGGSGGSGVYIEGAATLRTQVRGNYIGGSGVRAFGNQGSGVFIGGGSSQNLLRGNLLLANGVAGVDLNNADANTLAANFVGAVAAGDVFPNPRGIRVYAGSAGNVIGGSDVADRNYITAGSFYGIGLFNMGTNANRVENNWIGELLGGAPAGVQGPGVLIQEGAQFNEIRANLIAWSLGPGVWIRNLGTLTRDNEVLGNTVRNGVVEGVRISDGASFNQIGGESTGEANQIRDNDGAGIVVSGGDGNALWGNGLMFNEGPAIDLGGDGATANDAGDVDTGPNRLQNFPQLGALIRDASSTRVSYQLDSAPNRSYRIELYGYAAACAPGGSGQGLRALVQNVQTGADGRASGELQLPIRLPGLVSATATDLVTLDTSELGNCVSDPAEIFSNGFESS